MEYFPIMLDLTGKRCLVVGVGQVGLRKIQRLLKANPQSVLAIDPDIDQETKKSLERDTRVKILHRQFLPDDLEGCFLVIASSSDPNINRQISALCQKRNILCNIVDQPEKCNFILPALHQQGELMICVSTSGASPALAKKIRHKLAMEFGPEYRLWLSFLRKARNRIIALGTGSDLNREVFELLSSEETLAFIKAQDPQGLICHLQRVMSQKTPAAIWSQYLARLTEVVNEFFQHT